LESLFSPDLLIISSFGNIFFNGVVFFSSSKEKKGIFLINALKKS